MSTKEQLESSESMTTQSQPELSLGSPPKGCENLLEKESKADRMNFLSNGASKKKTSPILGGSPDRYCEVHVILPR